MTHRVIQWATGNVGKYALRAILDHPDLELVGVYTYNPEKHGVDAGEILGDAPVGVRATRDLDALLALEADCVVYAPLTLDLDEVCKVLESGKNLISLPGLLHPATLGSQAVDRLEAACQRGGSSVHGTGINPGWVGEVLPLTMSGLCQQIEQIHVKEIGDWSHYTSPEMVFDLFRFGASPAEVDLEENAFLRTIGAYFRESIDMVAAGLEIRLDDFTIEQELALAPGSYEMAAGTIAEGGVAGQRYRFTGRVEGDPVIIIETVWAVVPDLPGDWPRSGESRWIATLEGRPSFRCEFTPALTFDPDRKDVSDDGGEMSLLGTAMHAIHAIRHVCQADPGIRTFLDLPIITAAGAHRRRRAGPS
ncbi:MAG: dihydrodipicolinate reductase [Deltaproteobacteria bacterium]|jgi:hypothetical protein|nr:dihydrodipicolinate reductase [Deltaproteobacteria bacterium]